MERIGPTGKSSSFSSRARRKAAAGGRTKKTVFSSILADAQPVDASARIGGASWNEREDTRRLEELLDEVYEIGERVKKNPSRESVFAYKKSVRQLVRIAVERSLAVEEQTSSPNILRQKRFTLVRVIDQKLDRLISEVLVGQRPTMDVLGRIDEINGLLVDLMS